MLSEEIARYILDTGYEDLPQAVREKAKACLMDWLACACAGSRLEPVRVMLDVLVPENNRGKCRFIGHTQSGDCLTAALINGTMSHAIEFDDIYKFGLYHPAAPVISGAFAVAEASESNGADFLTALVLGYEVSNRLAAAVNPSHYRFWHTTGTVGTFGAAAAACKLLKANEEQIIWALGNAGTQAAGLWECTGTMAKPLHAGKAAMNGVLAALLALGGFTGPPAILDGPRGFLKAMSAFAGAEKAIFASLGKGYTILDTTFKAYPSCGHTHPAIDAVLALKDDCPAGPELIEEIKVGTYGAALQVAGKGSPRSTTEAKFSIPYCVACALQDGKVVLDHFLHWPPPQSLVRLMNMVHLAGDEECEKSFPGKRGAVVEVKTKNNRYIKRVSCRKGDPENPLTLTELWTKFTNLASSVLDPNQWEAQKNILDHVEDLADLSMIQLHRG
ncbi:MmgE/PrpD family protein [Candidatus Formimonas warabiya]|uniref:MmgE/PrpD family protein n=1 Tax=Formimonas warabiya TaxID=1761012 RepID=A0A3G1KRA8_FORW1|nr:MmgE/PrpD family protein [Candidatus Formimonas warabiya]ATW24976.1 hypothetical protein DCMF_09495 [Candidatus Formimonas warabiya]